MMKQRDADPCVVADEIHQLRWGGYFDLVVKNLNSKTKSGPSYWLASYVRKLGNLAKRGEDRLD